MAERNLSIRLSVVDGGKVKAELSEIGEKGERSLKKIEAAATPASSGLKLLSSAANDAKFQLQAATDRLGMLGSVLGKLGPAGLIAGASIAGLGVGITALVMPVARVGDEFFKLSQKTGVSVEALIALAAFNLRQMLRRHAYLGRQHLQRQTTLDALAAQEGGNQSVHGRSVAQPRDNRSYDRVNSCWDAIFFGMRSVLAGGVTH